MIKQLLVCIIFPICIKGGSVLVDYLKLIKTTTVIVTTLLLMIMMLFGAIVTTYAQPPSVGAAIIHGSTENEKISCGTAGSKNTQGLYFSAYTRDGSLDGYWDIASSISGAENKGGYISGGRSNGNTYELAGQELHDGICHTKVDKNVIISGKCGEGVAINFKTINGTGGDVATNFKITNGTNQTFTGNVKCVGQTGFK